VDSDKDLTGLVLYYKTYENTALKKIDLTKFDLSKEGKEMSIVLTIPPNPSLT
jgi:hypothetical protein